MKISRNRDLIFWERNDRITKRSEEGRTVLAKNKRTFFDSRRGGFDESQKHGPASGYHAGKLSAGKVRNSNFEMERIDVPV